MRFLILIVALGWAVITMAEPSLAQTCTNNIVIVNGKMLRCQTCGMVTTCI